MVKKILINLAFIVCSLSILIIGGGYICGYDVFMKTNSYCFTVSNCEGLNNGCLVYINGYNVGSVKNIIFDTKNYSTKIVFSVDKNIKVTNKSSIRIEKPLFGDKYLNLIIKDGEILKSGECLTDVVEKNIVIGELLYNVNNTLKTLSTVLKSAEDNNFVCKVGKLIESTTVLLQSLNVNNINESVGTFKKLLESLDTLVKDLNNNPKKYLRLLLS